MKNRIVAACFIVLLSSGIAFGENGFTPGKCATKPTVSLLQHARLLWDHIAKKL